MRVSWFLLGRRGGQLVVVFQILVVLPEICLNDEAAVACDSSMVTAEDSIVSERCAHLCYGEMRKAEVPKVEGLWGLSRHGSHRTSCILHIVAVVSRPHWQVEQPV